MLPLKKTLKIEDSILEIPELELYKGKVVELTIKEKIQERKQVLDKFFSLCGQIDIDTKEVDKLREASYISPYGPMTSTFQV